MIMLVGFVPPFDLLLDASNVCVAQLSACRH
jgi:hypothetical protein